MSLEEKRTNTSILEEANTDSITTTTMKHQLRWTGHGPRRSTGQRAPVKDLHGESGCMKAPPYIKIISQQAARLKKQQRKGGLSTEQAPTHSLEMCCSQLASFRTGLFKKTKKNKNIKPRHQHAHLVSPSLTYQVLTSGKNFPLLEYSPRLHKNLFYTERTFTYVHTRIRRPYFSCSV